jgi:hypothetical protein
MNFLRVQGMDIKIKKRSRLLNGSLYSTGTEALRTDIKFTSLSTAYVNTHTLDIYKPTASCMAVRVADCISCNRPAAAAITEPRHMISPLSLLEQLKHCITGNEKVATICIGGF